MLVMAWEIEKPILIVLNIGSFHKKVKVAFVKIRQLECSPNAER